VLWSKENLMRRILVAVDGTQASREAARTALEFAERLCMQVTFVHVLPERVTEEGEAPEFAAFENACEQYAEELVNEACCTAGSRSRLADTRVVHGEPVSVISKLAAEEDVDMVIVGARARGPVARTLLGTVSGGLMCRCPKPVMVVPERAAAAEAQRAAS
jgi:nucleotide-binding universal stress UspA family protein